MSMLKKLKYFGICFKFCGSFPEPTNRCPSLTRAVLPTLATFCFTGVSEYLEDLISRVDAPGLNYLHLQFFDQPIFDVPQLSQLFHRFERLRSPLKAIIVIYEGAIKVSMSSPVGNSDILSMILLCTGLDRQISLLGQFCAQCLPLLSHVTKLDLYRVHHTQTDQQGSGTWLRLIRPFNALQILRVWELELEIQIARTLGELTGEGVTEVFPMLHTIMLGWFHRVEFLVVPLLKPFVDARQLLDRPVEVKID